MKVPAEKVTAFLDQIKALAEDINYTIRSGDDGFEEAVNDQVGNISKAIEVFKLQELSVVTPIEKASKKYAREYDLLADKPEKTSHENIMLYKSEMYFAIKRQLKRNIGLSECPSSELENFIEGLIGYDAKYEKLIYTNEWFYTSLAVIKEVADEIIEQRKKTPQLKMF